MGLVRAHLPPNHRIRDMMLGAMITRVSKNRLREQLRDVGSAFVTGEALPSRGPGAVSTASLQVALNLFNLLLGHAKVGAGARAVRVRVRACECVCALLLCASRAGTDVLATMLRSLPSLRCAVVRATR